MKLRHKLLLVAAGALVVPVGGWVYVRQMDDALRSAREQAQLATAKLIARSLDQTAGMLSAAGGWYVLRARAPFTVDGFADDWAALAPWQQRFGDGKSLLLARWNGSLYALATVTDTSRRRINPSMPAGGYDDLDVALGIGEAVCRYRLAAAAPGRIAAAALAPAPAACPDPLHAVWWENGSGYRLEWQMAVPVDRLGIAAHDGGTARVGPPSMKPLLHSSAARSARLGRFAPPQGRIRLLSHAGWVLADTGAPQNMGKRVDHGWLSALAYRLLVSGPLDTDRDLDTDPPRLDAPAVRQALSGEAATRWRRADQGNGVVLTAVVPLPAPGAHVGAVVLEDREGAMPLLANPGLLWLLLASFALLLASSITLAVFAVGLGRRIAGLSAQAERASANAGHAAALAPPDVQPDDELGDLARSHAQLLAATDRHSEYLRTLASKLSHELHTPLAVVTSSLDNLDSAELPASQNTYVTRAREGATRMSALVRAMGAASRVERAIAAAEAEDFDLRALVAGCADGYHLLAGEQRFELGLPDAMLALHGAPDLIAQALDKLFDNAVSFTPARGWIRLTLAPAADGAVIDCANQGPLLPPDMAERVFDSLVSMREADAGGAHLGLGLHIVQLVAAQHQGRISAANLDSGDGVRFTLTLRGMPRRSIAEPPHAKLIGIGAP